MNNEVRVEVLETLRNIRQELQDNAEDSIISQLDQVINDLEEAEADCLEASTSHDILELLGKIVEKLPFILSLIDRLNG